MATQDSKAGGGVLFAASTPEDELRALFDELDDGEYWDYSEYNYDSLIGVTEDLARQSVLAAGGRIEEDAAGREYFLIPIQEPEAPALEQSWEPEQPAGSVYTADELAEINGRRRRP